MYTYRHPYRPFEFTPSYIERRGQLSLFRAINVGRVIGFIGSGATAAYGRPTWSDLVETAVAAVKDSATLSKRREIKEQWEVLKSMHDRIEARNQSPETLILALDLAERIAVQLGPKTAEDLRAKITGAMDISRSKSMGERVKKLNGWAGTCPLNPYVHPIEKMMTDLRITRFMTLNYDAEIEREFERTHRVTNHTEFDPDDNEEISTFRGVTDQVAGKASNQHTLAFGDGAGKSVLSVNLDSENISALVNFALLPNRYDAQVFHLHGRLDQSDTMVLTESDYQKRYLGSVEKAFGFDEALSTVFKGNDVLFVGLGMNEADPFRPLRQFTSQDSEHGLNVRNVYTLRERQTEFDLNAKGQGEKWLNEVLQNNLPPICTGLPEAKGKVIQDSLDDTEFSLKLKAQYGIHTIFYGGHIDRLLGFIAHTLDQIAKGAFKSSVQRARICMLLDRFVDYLDHSKFNDHSENRFYDLLQSKDGEEPEAMVQWLRERLRTLSASYGKTPLEAAERASLQAWTGEFKTMLRSRKLEVAIVNLSRRQAQWWDDWRAIPSKRDTRFRKAYVTGDTQYPCLARHRPDYLPWEKGDDATTMKKLRKISLFEEISSLEVQQCDDQGLGKRILRFAMPRGAGKGSLMHMLQQEVRGEGDPKENRFVLDTLFEDTENPTDFRYHGAFLVHLSFSMEFASVIDSLSRFIEDALIGLFKNKRTADHALAALKDLANADKDYQILRLLNDNRSDLKELKDGGDEAFEAVQAKLKTLDFSADKEDFASRNHRIDACRNMMLAYRRLALKLSEGTGGPAVPRLLIFFSGLDRLCDDSGTAFNPMYRAFFRMLTGDGRKSSREADDMMPMDLVLLTGTEKPPIRYLSEQVSEDVLNTWLWHPTGSYPAYKTHHHIPGSDVYLQRWPTVGELKMKDRIWFDNATDPIRRFKSVLDPKSYDKKSPPLLHLHSTIRQLLNTNVALSGWCAGAYDAFSKFPVDDPAKSEVEKAECRSFLIDLDGAADRAGVSGVLTEILNAHAARMRQDWQSDIARADANGTGNEEEEEKRGVWPNIKADLMDMILRHLSLFPLPVQIRVLYGCDEIRFLLHRMYARLKGKADTGEDMRTLRRAWCLRALREMLTQLSQRHILIKVQPKQRKDRNGSGDDAWTAAHERYTIQSVLRDHLSKRMDFSVPDQGERNFFQVSLYCDQPRDLPAPKVEHYRMFEAIMNRQIQNTRKTIWCLHQLEKGKVPDEGKLVVDSQLAYEGSLRRLAGDAVVADGATKIDVDASMASLNAATHRVRALYAMLRGSFSAGAITRLEQVPFDDFSDQPLEHFRGWLRGVTNAAVSLGQLKAFTHELTKGDYKTLETNEITNPRSIELEFNSSNGDIEPLQQPLYRDEFGWLFNERGTIALVQGNLYDAIPLFERAIHVMAHRDSGGHSDASLHAAVRRVRLNLSVAHIERGNLDKAELLLRSLVLTDDTSRHHGSTVSWIARGYLGLIKHIGGDLRTAQKLYDETIARADEKQLLRLQSIFRSHRADLHRALGDFTSARQDAELAVAAAKHSEQRDVEWNSRLTQVKIALKQTDSINVKTSQTIESCITYARSMHIPRLESNALRLQAELLALQGDRVMSGRLASNAAAIASHAGLRLMKLSALNLYGRVLTDRGDPHIGQEIVAEARREAERRGYLNQKTAM